MKYCTNCGKEIEEDSHYCKICGKKIENTTISNKTKHTTESSTKSDKEEGRKRHKRAITVGWLGALFFTPLGIIMGFYLITQKNHYAKMQGWYVLGISIIWIVTWNWIIVPILFGY